MSTSRKFNIQQIQGRILLRTLSKAFIARMPALQGHEWDGKLDRPPWLWGDRSRISDLINEISEALTELQGDNCAYCGMQLNVTSAPQVEHIAPKGNGRYPRFMFHVSNLVLACSLCNGFEKKEREHNFNTIVTVAPDYENCVFNIVHPYLHNPDDHYEFKIQGIEVLIFHKTPEGKRSIEVFMLAEEPLTTERGKIAMLNAYNFDEKFKNIFDAAIATAHS